jgi:hypothetical protein
MRRLIPAVLATAMLAACSESTSPEPTPVREQHPSWSVTLPGTSTTINSASCNLVSSSKGDVLCSYNISNPDGLLLNVIPAAIVDIAYQCQSPSTGKVMSTGTDRRWVEQRHSSVTAITYSATNEPLPTAALFNFSNGPGAKLNPCKGKQTPVVTNYSQQYWEVRIEKDITSVCAGSDDRLGCQAL